MLTGSQTPKRSSNRPPGFEPDYNPREETRVLLGQVKGILREYREHLPLTGRQIFYRLVGAYDYPKTEKAYRNLLDKLGRARRAEGTEFHIPWSAIRDDRISEEGGDDYGYESPEEYYRTYEQLRNYYSRSWHEDQPVFVSLLCEAGGMVPMLADAVEDYRIPVASSGGFDSITAKHDLFDRALKRYRKLGQRTLFLHVGDHDPSGYHIHNSLNVDLLAFCEGKGVPGIIELKRVAITPQQIQDLAIPLPPPPEPGMAPGSVKVSAKKAHAKEFVSRGLEPAAQLEAIEPNTLKEIVREAVEESLDMDTLRESQAREAREYAEVQEKLDEVNEVLREAFSRD